MNESSSQYSLVLIGRYPGKDMAVAQALARCMGREESWGLRIVSSSPIVFFDKLNERQARLIDKALADVAKAGCRFEIQPGPIETLPKVGWANPPKINGQTLSDIAPGTETRLAAVGPRPAASVTPLAMPIPSPGGATGAPSPVLSMAPSESGSQASATLFVNCPYTGQKIKLTLNITLSRGDSGTAISVTASAAQPVSRMPERSPSAVSGTVIPPRLPQYASPNVASSTAPIRQTGGQSPIHGSGTYARPQIAATSGRAENTAKAPTQANVIPSHVQAEGGAPNPALPPPTFPPNPPWRRNVVDEAQLPDVPVLPSPMKNSPKAQILAEQPLPLDSQPMDLSTFEANLGVKPREDIRPFVDSGPQVYSQFEALDSDDDVNDDPDSAQILCSVFIERSSSPVVHELVAEFHGIPESEASEMCVAGPVPLAENIPLFEAKDIKRRCAEINVFARIVRPE